MASHNPEVTLMDTQGTSFTAEVGRGEEAVIQIPGIQPDDGVMAHLINVDPSRGLVASIIHLKAGTTIPAHYHEGFAEAHYVLEGDLTNDGQEFGPGGFITHAAGVVHGPHSSRNGCRVLTIQTGHPGPEQSDHHLAESGQGTSA
jgi:quercetin dioxygenase-like cupin family protein